jgi:hypothetical protein
MSTVLKPQTEGKATDKEVLLNVEGEPRFMMVPLKRLMMFP